MAKDTSYALRNQIIYSVFVRQFSSKGTFRAVEEALPRIRALGCDILWLMPIHPIGIVCRKGTLGSPYAIRDYRAVNPELGTREDLEHLVRAAHDQGMKCIIDVVYNHTSPDSVLAREHPEWFYHRPDGSYGNHVGDWEDIIDLDYTHPELWEYQIETLKMWAGVVDGFRCDVAPLIPLDFWLQARAEVERVHPGCLWLAESVEPVFTLDNRERGMTSLSDAEIFQAFDLSYEYDIYHDWVSYLVGERPLGDYLSRVNQQEYLYPENYGKLRFLENHDRPRMRFLLPDPQVRRNWLAFQYFQKGTVLLYNGQERECAHRPSLFERDSISWEEGTDISPLLRRLAAIKRHPAMTRSRYHVKDAGNGIILAEHRGEAGRLLGVFSTRGTSGIVRVDMEDRVCENLVDGRQILIESGLLSTEGEPVILDLSGEAP